MKKYLILILILATSCISPQADLRLEGDIFGYQDDDYCMIIFHVKNYGNKPALWAKANIQVLETEGGNILDVYDEYLGDFLPGETRRFESDLPRQFQWGDDITIKMIFRWER